MARSGRSAANCRLHSYRHISWLLGYLLSTAPVMAYDGAAEGELMASFTPQNTPAPTSVQFTDDYMLLSENNRSGYLQDSPYLNRREGAGTEKNRHPAERIPTAAELHRKAMEERKAAKAAVPSEPVLAPIVDSAPAAAAVQAAPTQPPQMMEVEKLEVKAEKEATVEVVEDKIKAAPPVSEEKTKRVVMQAMPAPEPEPEPAPAPDPAPAEAEHILKAPELPADDAVPQFEVVPAATPEPAPKPEAKPLQGEELPSEMTQPKPGEGADASPQARVLSKIAAAISALRQQVMPEEEPVVTAVAPAPVPAPQPTPEPVQEVAAPAQPTDAVQTPEVVVAAKDSAPVTEKAPELAQPELPQPAPAKKAEIAVKEPVPAPVLHLVEQLKQQAKERTAQEKIALEKPRAAPKLPVQQKADPDAQLEEAAASSPLSFLQELQKVVGDFTATPQEIAPAESGKVQNLAEQWKAKAIAAPVQVATMPPAAPAPKPENGNVLTTLSRQLMLEPETSVKSQPAEEIEPARMLFRQSHEKAPAPLMRQKKSLPAAEAKATDAEESLLRHAEQERQPETAPDQEEASASPAPEKSNKAEDKPAAKGIIKVIPINIKPGDKPFSKWDAPIEGKLQLVNAEEEVTIEPVKVSKVTKVIGGGTTVENPPKPEMVEAQLPVSVPVYPDSLTQEITTPAPKIIPAQTVSAVRKSDLGTVPLPAALPAVAPFSARREEAEIYEPRLSRETKSLLAGLPGGVGSPEPLKQSKPMTVKHSGTPEMEVAAGDELDIHEAKGVKIEVKRPDFNANNYLEDAYHALLKEDLGTAMNRYQAVLEAQPKNNEARFGLATTYHRMGELAMARNLYAEILATEPGHLEALNNLLVLVSQESPKEALDELKKLEAKNPDFSPLPAQMAALYAQNQDFENAIICIRRASKIDPNNLAYRYNAAVLMDRAGKRQEAIELYTSLKRSYQSGQNIPADMAAIQERLTFLLSNRG